jgi:hypothetical protein
MVTSVEDDDTKLVGIAGDKTGASPHNLLADTLGDELKLATQGQARVFSLSLKDRAAVLPGGFAADAAYWIDPKSGAWITSTYYRHDLPKWAQDFNAGNRVAKYWDRDWKNANGDTLRSTAHRKSKDGSDAGFYEVIGSTPFANEYELEFAKELVVYENLGAGQATDLLAISLSANDILGHQVGPDSPEMAAMALALDRELADFFAFLGHQVGLANVWIALSADHGVSPCPMPRRSSASPPPIWTRANSKRKSTARSLRSFLPATRRLHQARLPARLARPGCLRRRSPQGARRRIRRRRSHEASRTARLLHQVPTCRRRSPRNRSRQKVLEQLFTRRRLVCHGSPGALHRRPGERHRPRLALHLRHARARWLSTDCRFSPGTYRTTPSRSIWQPRSRRCSASTLLLTPWGACSPRRLPRHIRPRMLRDLPTLDRLTKERRSDILLRKRRQVFPDLSVSFAGIRSRIPSSRPAAPSATASSSRMWSTSTSWVDSWSKVSRGSR